MNRYRQLYPILVSALVVWILPAVATAAVPPQQRDCSAIAGDQYNDRLDCKTENANVALYGYVDAVIDFEKASRSYGRAPIFTDAQLEHFDQARERAQNAKDRSHQAKAFRGQVMKQKPQDEDCYVKEIIGDGKGDDIQPCEGNEDCAEEIGDGVGDDDGICKVKGNPNQREVCVQVCQQPLLDDDENYDGNTAFDTEQGLDELVVALDEAADEVQKATSRMHDYYGTKPSHSADECDMYEFDLFPGPVALQLSQVAKNVSGAAFNTCSVACNQDAFGWNCEAVCVVFAVIGGIAGSIDDGFNVADGNNGSAQLDRVARCTTQMNDDIADLQASAGNTEAALDDIQLQLDDLGKRMDALMSFMEGRFLDVEDYLCTPQGQRECFPDGVERAIETPLTQRAPSSRPIKR